jgi:hypothetical protein
MERYPYVVEGVVKDCEPNGRRPGLDLYLPWAVAKQEGWVHRVPVEILLDEGEPWRGTVGIKPPNLPWVHRPLRRMGNRVSMRDWLLESGLRHDGRLEVIIEGHNRLRLGQLLETGSWSPGRAPEERVATGRTSQRVSARAANQPVERPQEALPADRALSLTERESILSLEKAYWRSITAKEAAAERNFASWLPQARSLGYLTRDQLIEIATWKSARPRRRYESNSEQAVRQATAAAFRAADTAGAVTALCRLNGVALRTASALLHWMRPEEFPILDFRVVKALGLPLPSSWEDISYYQHVAESIRSVAAAVSVDLRTIDRALWTLDKLEGYSDQRS